MTPEAFAASREAGWRELEDSLRRARRGSLRRLPAADIERFALLYRRAASDLAIARRDFPTAGVTAYLNGLCARANPLLYRGAPFRPGDVPSFFATGLPRAVRAMGPYVLASLVLMLTGLAAGWIAVVRRPDLAPSLVPPSLFDEMARGNVHGSVIGAPLLASVIIQNNIRVVLICFAGGVLLGLPTAAILLANGWMLGTLAAAVHSGGYDAAFWSLIVPHGVIELSVIVIAGGTGLMLGDSVLRPGLRRRADSLADAAGRAAVTAVGIACLLVVAGTLEAFVSPSGASEAAKFAVGGGTGVLLYSWLLLAGRAPRRRRRPPSLDRVVEASAAEAAPGWTV